jgi:DNA-binding CsgD family transcriptional regulator/tetratricopeptide (TPR) repeat protein
LIEGRLLGGSHPGLTPKAPGSVEPRLVGRDRELRLLADRVDEVRRGRGRLLLIEGEAGSGKTSLLDESELLASGFAVFRGGGHEIDRDRPFGVISDALGIARSSVDKERRSIARSLRRAGSAGLDETLRYRIVEDILTLLEREALVRPVLLALDDLHWADDPSILVVHHLARRIAHLPICLIVARRPRPSGMDDLAEMTADPHVDRVALQPLDDENVARLVSRILGAAPATGLRALLAKAGGNPFFVTELLAALQEGGSIDIEGATAEVALVDVRPELRMVILGRLSGLSPGTVNVLRMASILGTTFTAHDLAVCLGSRPTDLVAPLDEAVTAGVLHPEDDRLAFRHDLIRQALYTDIPASIRNSLHLQVARALRLSGAPPTHSAPHFAAGATFGDVEAIASLRTAAADVASTEPETAHRWMSRALELLDPADERHDEIVVDLCGIVLRLGDAGAAEELARSALARARSPERRSTLVRTLAAALDQQDRCLEAAAVSERESRATDFDDVTRIRLAADAVEYRGHMERVAAEPAAREVLRRALAVGDDVAIRGVLAALYHAAMWRGDYLEAVLLGERIATYADTSDSFIVTTGIMGGALAYAGRTREALASFRSEMSALESRRDVRPMALVLTHLASLEAGEGLWDDAISDAEAAFSLATEFRQDARHDEAAALLAILATRRGEHDRASRLLGSLRSSRQFVASIAMAKHAVATGDQRGALGIMREAWELAETTGRISDLPRYAVDHVRLELIVGDPARAADAASTVERIARATGVPPTELTAVRCRGLVAADPVRLLQAADDFGAAGFVDERAATLEDAGVTLAAAGRAVEALPLLREAADYYERVGAVYDQRRIDAAFRTQGVRRGRRGPRPRAKTGWGSLTETELRILDLATEGLTNSEIGSRLFISGRTVERHLTHVFSKLAIDSRVELATLAAAERARA